MEVDFEANMECYIEQSLGPGGYVPLAQFLIERRMSAFGLKYEGEDWHKTD